MGRDFKNLEIYNIAYDLVLELYRLLEKEIKENRPNFSYWREP